MYRERTFRSNFWIVAFYSTAAVLIATPFVSPRIDRLLLFPPYVAGALAILAAFWALLYLACVAFRIQVGPDGVRCYDGIGRYHEVPWKSMRKVERWPGFYIVRHGTWGSAQSIPTWLTDNAGFREYVRRTAPEENPLRRCLGAQAISDRTA